MDRLPGVRAVGVIGLSPAVWLLAVLSLAVLALHPVALVPVALAGADGGELLGAFVAYRRSPGWWTVVAGSLGCVVAVGLLDAPGSIGALLLCLLVVAAWPLLLPAGRAVFAASGELTAADHVVRRSTSGERAGSGPLAPRVDGRSVEHRCGAWQVSSSRRQRAVGPAETTGVVRQRRSCLDELQRRRPRGIAAWTSGGARAASGPGRSLTPASGR